MPDPARPLRILHILRAPVGGAFRHVVDLATGQAERGHAVGLICDSTLGGERVEAALAAMAPQLRLGIARIAIPRAPGPGDIPALAQISRQIRRASPDVVHGHGAKGGAVARLAPFVRALRVYTPHGGSLHYGPDTWQGRIYGTLERLLMARTGLFLFESDFARQRFSDVIGAPKGLVRVVHNGVAEAEFSPVPPGPDAADFVFVGELRDLKGPDVLIDAVASLHRDGRAVRLVLVGDGPDRAALEAQVAHLGLGEHIRFAGFQPARHGFSLGRVLVMPSRADSLPYVAIEAAAAAMPLIATRIGGIPEIFGPEADRLIPAGDVAALAEALTRALAAPDVLAASTARLQTRIRASFSLAAMVDSVLAAYAEAMALTNAHRR